VHEAKRGRVDVQRLAEADRRREPRAPERLVDRRAARGGGVRDHADRDLRLIAEQRVAEHPVARAAHLDDRARFRVDHVGNVGAVDPRMPAADPIFAFGFEDRYAICNGD
jgi:hypothetical protein